jgi:hypothetical protein
MWSGLTPGWRARGTRTIELPRTKSTDDRKPFGGYGLRRFDRRGPMRLIGLAEANGYDAQAWFRRLPAIHFGKRGSRSIEWTRSHHRDSAQWWTKARAGRFWECEMHELGILWARR